MAKIIRINLDVFKEFFHSKQIGGFILLFCLLFSLLLANSTWGNAIHNLLNHELGYHSKNIHLRYPLVLWINDGLMSIFFLLVGLEIKREFIEGELSSRERATLPIFAALGGMLMPAGIYFIMNKNLPTASGWGIPMATDIAFALAIVSLLDKKVPNSLKVFLAALAIVDDLGAILVIAVFYTAKVHIYYLLYAAVILVFLSILNRWGVKKVVFYLIPGLFLWYFVHQSGIHATIAGVLLAFTIPTNQVKQISPLEQLEHYLTKPVNFFIMPIFALANTNIRFEKAMLTGLKSPLAFGIILGLVLGKPLGITLFSWLSIKLKLGSLPSGTNWKHLIGLGMLAGIGFTMSIFISLLSLKDIAHQTEAKIAILIASTLSGMVGYIFLTILDNRKIKKQ